MNVEAIKFRLKTYSKKHNRIHQYTIIRYFQERFLYRLSISEYRDNFFLKGGALIYVFHTESSRYTKDIDFLLSKLSSEHSILLEIFRKIGQIKVEDGVSFNTDQIAIGTIRKEGRYGGIRVKMLGRLDNIIQQLQIDIGLGDYVTPGPQDIEYPIIIKELSKPILKAYPIETMIAEKFEAMISLGEYNSRLKDFYDVYHFVEKCNADLLAQAIKNTFKRRKTLLVYNHPVFEKSFYQEEKRNKQWRIFLHKNELENIEFEKVYEKIYRFIFPIYQKLFYQK